MQLRAQLASILIFLASCSQSDGARKEATANCSDTRAVKCVVLSMTTSPSGDYAAVTKIDSYGGGFGTGYDSADVYIRYLGTGGVEKTDALLLSIEDNSDDLSAKNIHVRWLSENKMEIRYGHGDVNFQVVKFAGKDIVTYRDAGLDPAVH